MSDMNCRESYRNYRVGFRRNSPLLEQTRASLLKFNFTGHLLIALWHGLGCFSLRSAYFWQQ
jgi:hypothetical protein